ncbi:MAG: hypothetical protein WD534_03380, partial [Phycisphaeraceae bacterium]
YDRSSCVTRSRFTRRDNRDTLVYKGIIYMVVVFRPWDDCESILKTYFGESLSDYSDIAVGQRFWVYGISAYEGQVRYCLRDSPLILQIGQLPACLFEVIDDHTPSSWVVKIDHAMALSILPKQFAIDYFLDRLSDSDPEYVECFKRYREEVRRSLAPRDDRNEVLF